VKCLIQWCPNRLYPRKGPAGAFTMLEYRITSGNVCIYGTVMEIMIVIMIRALCVTRREAGQMRLRLKRTWRIWARQFGAMSLARVTSVPNDMAYECVIYQESNKNTHHPSNQFCALLPAIANNKLQPSYSPKSIHTRMRITKSHP
jgi:hypothetical protein